MTLKQAPALDYNGLRNDLPIVAPTARPPLPGSRRGWAPQRKHVRKDPKARRVPLWGTGNRNQGSRLGNEPRRKLRHSRPNLVCLLQPKEHSLWVRWRQPFAQGRHRG